MTKKHKPHKTTKRHTTPSRNRYSILNPIAPIRVHTQTRRIQGVITLRDNCKLYTSNNTEQLKKYLTEKGLW